MAVLVPQEILDALTRVDMPVMDESSSPDDVVKVGDYQLPVHHCECLVLGSGAAGLRAAVEAKREGIDVLVASFSLYGGTSACSGSDKQTLHTAGTSNNGDNFKQLANDIGSGGCMDKDQAYIESVGSLGAFSGLQYLGLPLPQDRFGAVLRYQTDHDEVGRATSCGPRTSRLMVKVLAEEAVRLKIPFLRKSEGVEILVDRSGDQDRVAGVLVIDREHNDNPYGMSVILAPRVVLATGGPGELYRDSVYPKHCYGSLGMAVEAGLETCNLTESQFGIGTRRTEFPWNLSGTYVQVLPYIYSVDEQGNEHNFLAQYFRTTQELVSNVFRKGYQWPFHATRMLDYKSSLVDLAIYIESKKGYKIIMDFNRNPESVPGDKAFSLDNLDDDVRTYLENNEALQDLPIERLERMNPLAIELYKMHGHNVRELPLPFNVSNQHMNGGIAVDIWNRSSLEGCYAVGEVAGTHGVTRPGGAALNAGQVSGMRCAKHMAANRSTEKVELNAVLEQLETSVAFADKQLANENGNQIATTREAIQDRMSDYAGFICFVHEIEPALKAARALREAIYQFGFQIKKHNRIVEAYRWRHMSLLSEAVLSALHHYASNGGGSRGARALCSTLGAQTPAARDIDLKEYTFVEERDEDKSKKIVLTFTDNSFKIEEQEIREMEDPGKIFFEKNWHHYLTDGVYQDGFQHS